MTKLLAVPLCKLMLDASFFLTTCFFFTSNHYSFLLIVITFFLTFCLLENLKEKAALYKKQ